MIIVFWRNCVGLFFVNYFRVNPLFLLFRLSPSLPLLFPIWNGSYRGLRTFGVPRPTFSKNLYPPQSFIHIEILSILFDILLAVLVVGDDQRTRRRSNDPRRALR